MDSIFSKANLMGRSIGKSFGEGFNTERPIEPTTYLIYIKT